MKHAEKGPFKEEWYPEYNSKQCPYLRIDVMSVAENVFDLIIRIPVSQLKTPIQSAEHRICQWEKINSPFLINRSLERLSCKEINYIKNQGISCKKSEHLQAFSQ